MKPVKNLVRARKRARVAIALMAGAVALFAWHFYAYGQDKSGFPEGYDAVQAAPNSHRVIFENAFVRVLEVSLEPGTTEPFHHHRWPSFFIGYDTGGRTPHIRYHRPDGSVKDIPSKVEPTLKPGHWTVSWLEPEPMHAVENADPPGTDESASGPPWVRIEIKCHP